MPLVAFLILKSPGASSLGQIKLKHFKHRGSESQKRASVQPLGAKAALGASCDRVIARGWG